MGGSFKRKNKGNDLDEPLLNAREKISMWLNTRYIKWK